MQVLGIGDQGSRRVARLNLIVGEPIGNQQVNVYLRRNLG